MFKIVEVLNRDEIDECRKVAKKGTFSHGRVTNPHNLAKDNEQLHEPQAYKESATLLHAALMRCEDFINFAFPVAMAPPMITRYQIGHRYGAHADTAFLRLPGGILRSDLSCTLFISDPDSYDGGALRITLGDADVRFKLPPGSAIVYPSDTLHEVEPVTEGERLVAITFIQSRVADPFRRNLLYNLNEVAALEGLKMQPDNYTRLQLVQNQLLRHWGEKP